VDMANRKVVLASVGVLASNRPLVVGKVVVALESSLVQVETVSEEAVGALLLVVVVDTKAEVEALGMKLVVVVPKQKIE